MIVHIEILSKSLLLNVIICVTFNSRSFTKLLSLPFETSIFVHGPLWLSALVHCRVFFFFHVVVSVRAIIRRRRLRWKFIKSHFEKSDLTDRIFMTRNCFRCRARVFTQISISPASLPRYIHTYRTISANARLTYDNYLSRVCRWRELARPISRRRRCDVSRKKGRRGRG